MNNLTNFTGTVLDCVEDFIFNRKVVLDTNDYQKNALRWLSDIENAYAKLDDEESCDYLSQVFAGKLLRTKLFILNKRYLEPIEMEWAMWLLTYYFVLELEHTRRFLKYKDKFHELDVETTGYEMIWFSNLGSSLKKVTRSPSEMVAPLEELRLGAHELDELGSCGLDSDAHELDELGSFGLDSDAN
jgi:hypothetical protein